MIKTYDAIQKFDLEFQNDGELCTCAMVCAHLPKPWQLILLPPIRVTLRYALCADTSKSVNEHTFTLFQLTIIMRRRICRTKSTYSRSKEPKENVTYAMTRLVFVPDHRQRYREIDFLSIGSCMKLEADHDGFESRDGQCWNLFASYLSSSLPESTKKRK